MLGVVGAAATDGGNDGTTDGLRERPGAVRRAQGGGTNLGMVLGPPAPEEGGAPAPSVVAASSGGGHASGSIQPDVPEHPKAVAEEGAVADAICELPWPCAEALAVASCESTLRPDAVSWTGESFGLMQIHAETWAVFMDAHGFDFWNQWMIAEKNLQMAYIIWQRSGWGAWSCW